MLDFLAVSKKLVTFFSACSEISDVGATNRRISQSLGTLLLESRSTVVVSYAWFSSNFFSAEYAVEPLELVFSEPTPDEVMKQAFAAFFLVKPRIAVQTCCSTLLDLIFE